MPRPKRTKIASTTTTTTRVAKVPKAATPASRQQQQARTVPDRIDSLTDDSDGLVVKATRGRRRMPWQPEPQKNVDYTMTGALPAEQGKKFGRTPARQNPPPVVKSSESRRIPSSDASKQTRASYGSANTESQERSPTESRPALRSLAHSVPPVEDDDSSGFGNNLLTFTSLDSESFAHGTRPPSAMKVGATPAHETSILALTNFRRRARQPSLLRMVHQTTDVEDNDLDGLDDLDNLDDFHPEHESTPLHLHKSTHGAEARNNSGFNISSSGSRGRKRKLSSPIIQVPRSSPPYDPPSGADVTESRSTSPSLPDGMVENQEGVVATQEEANLEIMSETMAPPRSSSSPVEETGDPSDSPVKPRQTRIGGAPKRADRDLDSDGDELDRRTKSRSKSKPKAHQGISTARLQAMLPRRRTRVSEERLEYNTEASDESIDSDQDELQLPVSRRAPSGRKQVNTKASKKPARAIKKATAPIQPAQRKTRDYGRRLSSDKENESADIVEDGSDDVEDTTETSIVIPKPQLEALVKKFEDVDAWEMDFESVDVNGDDSSPWR